MMKRRARRIWSTQLGRFQPQLGSMEANECRFGAPKPLFKEAISVQSVSHLDAESAPYASFIFFYRGERTSLPPFPPPGSNTDPSTGQLQKMGIMPKPKSRPSKTPLSSVPNSPVKGSVDSALKDATSTPSASDRRKSGFKSFSDLGASTPEKTSRASSPQKKSFGGFRGAAGEEDDEEEEEKEGDEMEEDDTVAPGRNGDEKVDKELAGEVKKITVCPSPHLHAIEHAKLTDPSSNAPTTPPTLPPTTHPKPAHLPPPALLPPALRNKPPSRRQSPKSRISGTPSEASIHLSIQAGARARVTRAGLTALPSHQQRGGESRGRLTSARLLRLGLEGGMMRFCSSMN